jgi:hypothetical protein
MAIWRERREGGDQQGIKEQGEERGKGCTIAKCLSFKFL